MNGKTTEPGVIIPFEPPRGSLVGKHKIRVNVVLRRDSLAAIDIAAQTSGTSRSSFFEQAGLLLAEQPQLIDTPAGRIRRAAAVLAEASRQALEIMSGK